MLHSIVVWQYVAVREAHVCNWWLILYSRINQYALYLHGNTGSFEECPSSVPLSWKLRCHYQCCLVCFLKVVVQDLKVTASMSIVTVFELPLDCCCLFPFYLTFGALVSQFFWSLRRLFDVCLSTHLSSALVSQQMKNDWHHQIQSNVSCVTLPPPRQGLLPSSFCLPTRDGAY